MNSTKPDIASGASSPETSTNLLTSPLRRFRVLTTVLVIAYHRHVLRPEDSRDLIQRALAFFAGGVMLTPEERVATAAALRRLQGIYDDGATVYSGSALLGQIGGFIIAVLGVFGKTGASLPTELIVSFICLGIIAVALGTWASIKEKSFRKPETSLNLLIEKIEESASPPVESVESWSAPFCHALDAAFEDSTPEFKAKIAALHACDDNEIVRLMNLASIEQLRTVRYPRHRTSGVSRRLGQHKLLLTSHGHPAIFHDSELHRKSRFASLSMQAPGAASLDSLSEDDSTSDEGVDRKRSKVSK